MGANSVKLTVASPVEKPVSRDISWPTTLHLYVRAGGRCQLRGCNDYLLEHHVTKKGGNFAQRAHIYAFSPSGPRGHPDGEFDPHHIGNLMLLCPKCHKLIDDNPEEYPVDRLKRDKKEHESRILRLTETPPDLTTVYVSTVELISNSTPGCSSSTWAYSGNGFFPRRWCWSWIERNSGGSWTFGMG